MAADGSRLDDTSFSDCATHANWGIKVPYESKRHAMHPEDVKPDPAYDVNRELCRGWVTWQITLPPPGCRYHVEAVTSFGTHLAEWDFETPGPTITPFSLK